MTVVILESSDKIFCYFQLYTDEFAEAVRLEALFLGHNQLTSLNGSLTSAKRLKEFNATHNQFEIFSMAELRGPDYLEYVDLSHNRISRLLVSRRTKYPAPKTASSLLKFYF